MTTVDGAASATWTLHYEVTKTSTTTLSGKEGPYNTQEEANAAAEAAKNNAIAQLQNEAQAMVDAAIAEAKAQLATITIDYKETTVPHGFDPTDSSSGSVSVPSNGSATAVVENQPWQAHVTWEKRDALTGGRITEDAEYVFYEWNVDANEYEISSNYRVTRLENGLYTVTVTNPVYTDWTEGYVYYTQDNLGKFRIEEVAAPAGYTDAALQGTDWVEHWSQEFEITASDQTYSYTGNDADYNRPQGNKVIIKKIEAHTGEIIVDDAVFTLYQWNEERGLYEKSKDYAFVRDAEGLYTITCLHDDWSQYEEGNLYYEDTLCDVREDTVNSDGTTTEHPQYYTDYEPIDFSIDERAVTNDGQFVVVESKSPYGYYGDWTGDEDRTNYEAEDAGKRAYYIRLTDDGSTITIGNGNYNANVLTENQGGTLIDLGDKVVSLEVFGEAATEYPEDALYKNNPWYSSLTWEKRDALTGGRITEDAEYEIQEWNTEKGQYEKSTHYRVVRRDDGLYTVNLIDGAFFPGWEGKQGYVYYHQANEGKYRLVELTSPAGYTDAALQDGNWGEHWSQEFEVNDGHLTFSYTGKDADYNQPKGNRLVIKKIEAHTGEIIEDDAVFTLYQWNQARGLYEVSKDYAFTRDAEGLYTITSLHDDWTNYVEGNLYYEDTLCDVREDTVNSDGTISEHPIYYTDHEPVNFPIEDRAVTNDGQFVVVESRSPYGYYGDWTGSRETPNFEIEDAGKHAYYIRLNDDGSTITLTDGAYNAHVLTENKGGTLIELSDGSVVTLDVFSPAPEEYDENNLFRNYPWYSTVVWEKRDALTGGLVDADTEFEIQEWNPEKGQYEKSTYYQVVRRDDGKYTVHLIGDAFFEGWEGKQGVLYYHQANQGKYRIVELKAPASYNLKAWEHNNWVIGWSEEIVVHPDYPSYEFLGETASRNMPYKTKVLIKKVDDATGEFILPDTTWTLYEWNERNNQYEVSTNYKIVRREDGYYTVTTLHSDWTHYEEGYLYFEDTQTDYPDSGRWFSNEGKFLIVESQAPAGYYGDYWRNDEPGTHSTDNGSDLGKRGYQFKNLAVQTKMQNVSGITTAESRKATDLLMKCQYLDEITDGKGVVFCTGTPISNSAAELYTMMRYIQADTLREHGLYAFDAWAANFGETVSAMELAPEGTGYRMKTRFARFNNLPELISMWKLAADVQTADMLKLEVPELEGGKPTVIMCPPTELQKHTIQALGERAEAVRAGSVDPHMDNMLKITTDGRKLALDQRLLNPALPDDPGSKANACADKVYEIWAQTREQRSTQLIFSDLATPGTGAWNVYDDIRDKLIARGVPKEEIAYIHDANTDAKKAALFARVRAGKVRVLLGSTQKMGAGTNVQTKLIALHHLDVPWRPSDIEQREGRILRQGNENKRVQIFRYATEGSFDAYSWQLIENKQRYISQIMTSKTPARSCEDLDEATLTYAEVKALCAGNPLIKEKMDLDNEVARLSTLRSAHNAQIYELQDLVSIGYPAAIRRIGQELDALRQDAALFQSSLRKDDKGNEMFSAVIQGVTYTKRADADAALLEACKAAVAGAGEKKIGRYCGFDICVGYDPKIIGFAGYLQGEQRYRIELNPKQNFSSFRAVLENISAQIPVKIAAREEIEKNIESAKEAAKQPFAYEEEFQTKLARLNELNILLDQEKQELVQNEKENRMQKENVNLHAEENEDWEASTVEPAAKLPAGWKWTMYSDGSGRLEGPDKQSLYSYDRMTYASAGEIEYRKSNNSSWDVFPEGSLDRFREWAEQQLLQELKKEPLQYQEFLEHQSHQDDEIEKNPLDMEDAARQAGLTVQRDQDKPGAAYFDADQNVIHVSDAGSEEDVRLSELKGYADAVIQRTATVEQPVRDLESASLAVMLAARYDVGVSDRLSQQLASAHAEAVKCPTFDLPVTLQRLDKALDYCDHFLAHEQERALEQEAENEPEPEQVTELSPQSQAFMMDL